MTMTMVLTSKDLHIAIKRNDGMEYLLNKFSFREECELFEAIRKIVPAKSEEFIKILKKKQGINSRIEHRKSLYRMVQAFSMRILL